jgi:hypothetical protein
MKLLLSVKGLDGIYEVAEHLSSHIALETADDFSFALAYR